jgi:hypothetical protein
MATIGDKHVEGYSDYNIVNIANLHICSYVSGITVHYTV